MSQKRGLGKGLGALIPVDESLPPAGGVQQVPVAAVARNPRQPRQRFDEAELGELADSIRQHGVIQPLIVTAGPGPGGYTLIAGERRLEAAKRAGLAEVPVVVREASQQQLLELALIENVQRADLSPLEAAEAYRQLVDDFGLNHAEVAQRVGKQRVSVTNTLRLLGAAAEVQQALVDRQITEGHARALLGLPTLEAQAAALRTVLAKDLTVRQTEALARAFSGEKPPRPPEKPQPPSLRDLQSRFEGALGMPVTVRRGKKGGTVVIRYYSDEELNALAERLLPQG